MCRIWKLCLILCALQAAVTADSSEQYHGIDGSLCISSQFVETHETTSLRVCAMLCSNNQRCKAFSTADGPCRLFVFDKCSKSVRDCGCSRRGRLFVKRQSGLEPGALCPSGYGDDLCGVKYKMLFGNGNWSASRQRCESEPGLVIMADVDNATEMDQIDLLYNRSSPGKNVFLGGFQLPGSSEPSGGWVWASCGGNVSASLWAVGQPDNGGGQDVIRISPRTGIDDLKSTVGADVLCECVSPFG